MTTPEHSIELTREVAATPEAVYAAWTKPEAMRHWIGSHVEAEARVGGAYRFDNRHGDKVYVHTGEYQVLEPGRRVRMSFRVGTDDPAPDLNYRDEFIEAVLQALAGGRTWLTFTNGWDGDSLDAEGSEAVRAAWAEWLDLSAKALAETIVGRE